MSRLRRFRPSPALVVALVALFVSLGGAGYAALKLPRNSVGRAQLKRNAVVSSKVKDHSLTGSDINISHLGPVPVAQNAERFGGKVPGDFLLSTDDITIWYPGALVYPAASNGKVSRAYFAAASVEQGPTYQSSFATFILPLDRPSVAYGVGLTVKAARVCLVPDLNGYVDSVQIGVHYGTDLVPIGVAHTTAPMTYGGPRCKSLAVDPEPPIEGPMWLSIMATFTGPPPNTDEFDGVSVTFGPP